MNEAIRRRKAERLSQKQHAALASVSVPTIVAFDRGERTLSLAKAFDILRVVGLVEEPKGDGAQEAFVQEAFRRWRELTDKLPENAPARFPHGYYRFDYALQGDLKEVELHRFLPILKRAVSRHTGWPVFWIPTREHLRPYEHDGAVECWLGPRDEDVDRAFIDAAHCDFWRVSTNGRAFLIRGYQEDSEETFPPRKIFDTTLPIWRIGECLMHAGRLAEFLKMDSGAVVTVHFRALYRGLIGRTLTAWANPLARIVVEGAARSDEALLEAIVPVTEIERNLANCIQPIVGSLFERFGVAGLASKFVQSEVQRLQESRISEL